MATSLVILVVLVAAPPKPVLVVDVDDTLCITDYTHLLFGIGEDGTRALPDAKEAMRELSRKYRIVYLTARSALLTSKTSNWLTAHGFPDGPVFASAVTPKRQLLERIKRQLGRIDVGIGDKPSDARAYRDSGMLVIVVNPSLGRIYDRRDHIYDNWAEIRKAHLTRTPTR